MDRSPGYQVKIEDQLLYPNAAAMLSVRVCHDVGAPSVCELELRNRSVIRSGVTFSDNNRFAVGNQVEVAMGEAPQRVFLGEITGLDLEFRSGEEVLTVRGHDLGHRLLRGRKTCVFVNETDGEIVRKVAEEAGLEAKVGAGTDVSLPYVLQYNQTDWDFLRQRAGELGFDVRVEEKILLFQPYGSNTSAVLRLKRRDQSLLEFRPRLSAVGLADEVVVQGWSPRDKKVITSRVVAGDEGTTMGGTRVGSATAKEAFGRGRTVAAVVDRPVSSQAEADQIARGRLREMALSYITGEGLVLGCADLQAGTVIEIDDFGDYFSGLYYVTSVCHTFSRGGRYRTAFTVRRNAA